MASDQESADLGQDVKAEPSITAIPIEKSNDDLSTLGAIELLDTDERPIFILDLTSLTKTIPVYYNPSLRDVPLLESKVCKGKGARDPKYNVFMNWASSTRVDGSLLQTTYCGVRWTARILRNRWRILSGDARSQTAALLNSNQRQSEMPTSIPRLERSQTAAVDTPGHSLYPKTSASSRAELDAQLAAFRIRKDVDMPSFPSPAPLDLSASNAKVETVSRDIGRIDFTSPNTSMAITPHMQFVLDFDWASTELGAIDTWSPELRRMVNILMSDPRPAAMYWGKERTMIYNESYVVVTGQRHPRMMGKIFVDAWEEIAGEFVPAFDSAYETGKAYVLDDARFFIWRHGYLEETYYSLSIIPFNLEDGAVGL